MAYIKEDFICPNCKKKNRIKIYSEVSSSQIINIINREIFKFECSNCHEKIVLDYNTKVVDDNYTVYYNHDNNMEIENYSQNTRICEHFEDFKEKLLILNDGLNDILIEFIKEFLYKQLTPELKKLVSGIRYDSMNEENLVFYLLGYNKYIACKNDFYKDLLEKSIIKEPNKPVVIDEHTYSKYIKLR